MYLCSTQYCANITISDHQNTVIILTTVGITLEYYIRV